MPAITAERLATYAYARASAMAPGRGPPPTMLTTDAERSGSLQGGRVTSWSTRWNSARECRAVQTKVAEQDGAPQLRPWEHSLRGQHGRNDGQV